VKYYGFTGNSWWEIQKGFLDWHIKGFANYLIKFAAHA
jgi:hypothetical protein